MTTTYFFDKGNQYQIMSMQRQAISIIESFFDRSRSILGKPMFTISPEKVIVQLFYYSVAETGNNSLSNSNIQALGKALTKCFNRYVELRIIRLNHVGLDASILSQYLSKNYGKYSFARLLNILSAGFSSSLQQHKTNVLNLDKPYSKVTGVEMKVSGRLTTQRSIPRKTVKYGRLGSSIFSPKGEQSSMNNVGMTHTDFSQHTSKNKLGAFTVKVWMSQESR